MGKVSVWCYKITCQIECNLLFVRIVLAIIKRPVANWQTTISHLPASILHHPFPICHYAFHISQRWADCHRQPAMPLSVPHDGWSIIGLFYGQQTFKVFRIYDPLALWPKWVLGSLSLIKLAPRRWAHLVAVSIPFATCSTSICARTFNQCP